MRKNHINKLFVYTLQTFIIILLLCSNISKTWGTEKETIKENTEPKVHFITNTEKENFYLIKNYNTTPVKKNSSLISPFLFAAPTIDLNTITDGNNYDFQINPSATNLVYPTTVSPTVTSDLGISSAVITFSNILDSPNGERFVINKPPFETFYFNNPLDTRDYPIGGSTIRVTQTSSTTFSITETSSNPISNSDFSTFLGTLYYGNVESPYTDGIRTMDITITDTNGLTASAQTTIRLFTTPPVAVNDTNSVMANSTTTIAGNVLTDGTNDSGTTAISVTEVNVYPSKVGNSYATLYGSITIQSDGSYLYDVDEGNSSITGLRSGESIQDIISYTIEDTIGIKDYGYLTITINGVDEAPNAIDNSDSITAFVDASTSGNVITDASTGGTDSVDRGLSTLVWENEFPEGSFFIGLSNPISGESKVVDGVTLNFTSTDPDGIGIANQNQVVYRTDTNGGHTGYLGYAIDATTNPSDDTVLTIDFDQPVFNLGFLVVDIDYSQGTTWQDQIKIEGSLSGVNSTYQYVTTGGVVDAGSNTFYGIGSAIPDDATGNINVFFDQPINQLKLSYNYGPHATDTDQGGQIAGISDIYWEGASSIVVLKIGTTSGNLSASNLGTSYAGTYGTIIVNSDGSYEYIVDTTNPAVTALLVGQTLTDNFVYELSDGTNQDIANLVITINGSGTDSDGDGKADKIDLDDDNDGILDTDESLDCSNSINLTGIESTLTSSSYYDELTQKIIDVTIATTGTIDEGNANGDILITQGGTVTFSFSSPVTISLKHEVGITGNFDAGDTWELTSTGNFTIVDPNNDLSINSNSSGVLNFDALGTSVASESWELTTTTTSLKLDLKTGNTKSPINLALICGGFLDTDNDTIPDHLDTDSDGDGCFDAIEGDENVNITNLTSGRISGTINTNGVPNLVNSGGTADSGNDQGQAIGTSRVVNATPNLVITNPTTVCTPSTVDITTPAITTGSTSGTLTYWTDASATNTLATPTAVTADTYYIKLTSASGCYTIKSITVTADTNPGAALNTTTTTAICESTTKTLVGSPAGGTWSVESGGGSISGTTYTPANITSDTNVTIRYTIPANGSCSATTADVSFTVNSDPGAATNTTTTTAICESTTKTLVGSPAGGTW
ncbi:VCBS domain-containing protein, partial [uncultured Tenacibaculum sp.]|uniref:beta strand repeat-containing protein n=1 Tax=uncultured Tenacibaculum sp. TaxID=174713 RepID=UPI00261EAA21